MCKKSVISRYELKGEKIWQLSSYYMRFSPYPDAYITAHVNFAPVVIKNISDLGCFHVPPGHQKEIL